MKIKTVSHTVFEDTSRNILIHRPKATHAAAAMTPTMKLTVGAALLTEDQLRAAAKNATTGEYPWAKKMGDIIKSIDRSVDTGLGGMASDDGAIITKTVLDKLVGAFKNKGYIVKYHDRTDAYRFTRPSNAKQGFWSELLDDNENDETGSKAEYSLHWFNLDSSTASVHSMRDVADEEQNADDIIGVLLQGTDFSVSTLITYNRKTNTYHQNYNSVIVPESTIVGGIWKSLTPQGQIKVKNLRKFYEKKMPETLRKLEKSLREGNAPTPGLVPFLDSGPGVIENITNTGGVDPDTTLHYDLDNVHVSSAIPIKSRSIHADVDIGSGDDFISIHSFVEEALTQTGFNMVLMEKTRDYYKYSVTFRGLPLTTLNAGETTDLDSITEAIELAVGTLGWNTDADTFPLVKHAKSVTWIAAGMGVGMKISSAGSSLEFYRLG